MATNLNSVRDIEQTINSLDSQELTELYEWLAQHHPQAVDASLCADLESGRLDHAIFNALEDERNGLDHPL